MDLLGPIEREPDDLVGIIGRDDSRDFRPGAESDDGNPDLEGLEGSDMEKKARVRQIGRSIRCRRGGSKSSGERLKRTTRS